MNYTEKHTQLASLFDSAKDEIIIPGSRVEIRNCYFKSDSVPDSIFSGDDRLISENRSFSYPVFIPPCRASKKSILLLHGLNERSWVKYLAWAYFLCEVTGSYVVMFPISFHINRSPVAWRDPRAMMGSLNARKKLGGEISKASFANVALSNRLTDDPRRFIKSGYQTVEDIICLISAIRSGKHPVVPASVNTDIFAYSIGAFLAEILMISDPGGLFSGSKLFMFCGGSVFSNMNGESKLIMDKLAFEKVYSYYMDIFEKDIRERGSILNLLASGKVGLAFRSMIDYRRLRRSRETEFRRFGDRICTIAMMKDTVIPPAGIIETVSAGMKAPSKNIELWDFSFGYTHENPFPILTGPPADEVDRCFGRLILKAGRFLL
ncbi:MAG TPA: DUF6051 family protein [Bacteroidales bacterium]|nr:DUF6051 family protein [Bacteroidales bacterium]